MYQPKYGCFSSKNIRDQIPVEDRTPSTRLTFRQICDFFPFACRLVFYWLKSRAGWKILPINPFRPLKYKPYYGVPCDAIGCGSIGRDSRGAICKFGLCSGLVEQQVGPLRGDQFIIRINKHDNDDNCPMVYQKVLSAVPLNDNHDKH
ncbi:hypothetical protein AB6A40_006261 [Gnathostoma spinigerum]|uniref:Glycosyl-hydrolase family 116 N-terminal domain-containing protein n=1 Tax=Gnathostoma spinigerum TaxID=75299 RepID=A0ABD6ESM7_9BILA